MAEVEPMGRWQVSESLFSENFSANRNQRKKKISEKILSEKLKQRNFLPPKGCNSGNVFTRIAQGVIAKSLF